MNPCVSCGEPYTTYQKSCESWLCNVCTLTYIIPAPRIINVPLIEYGVRVRVKGSSIR